MRIALFGDIHSNHLALEACLREAKGFAPEAWVFLGDYVSDCAYPERTMELIWEVQARGNAYFVRGNREEYLLNHRAGAQDHWQTGSQTGSLLYTYEHLSARSLDFFEALPDQMRLEFPGCAPIRICHGAPGAVRRLLFPGTGESKAALEQVEEDILVGAHCHKQFEMNWKGKRLVNPGPVGIPTDGTTAARYALLDWCEGEWRPRLLSVDYDTEAAVREIRESGMSEMARVWARMSIHSITCGEEIAVKCIELARNLAVQEMGEPITGMIPERYWEIAAEKMGIL